MAIITLMSVSGSPGVTTAAIALALTWSRPVVLVDADMAAPNAIVAGYLKGQGVPPGTLIDLALAHRNTQVASALPAVTAQIPGTTVRFIPGLRAPEQAASMRPVWPELLACFDELDEAGTDVIIDAGRMGGAETPRALIAGADVALLTARTTLPPIVACANWIASLRQIVPDGGRAILGLCLVGAGRPYTVKEFTQVVPLPVLAEIAFDPVSAEVFSLGAPPGRGFETGPLRRSVKAAAAALEHQARARHDQLTAKAGPQ